MTFVRTNLADLNKPIPERREREREPVRCCTRRQSACDLGAILWLWVKIGYRMEWDSVVPV